jgi:uncharacterized protein (DUF2249 family)
MSSTALDLTQVDPDERYARLARTLTDLAPGAAVEVVTGEPPRKLLQRLIAERWGGFDWAPLSAAQGACRGVLRRRETPLPDSLAAFLTADHARCDALYLEAEDAAQAGNLARAEERFRAFHLGMLRHFEMEEQGFFTDFEARSGMGREGPTAVMREEHEQVRGLLRQMGDAVDEGDLATFLAGGETLLILMEQHNLKEQQVLYELADELFGPEAQALLKRLFLF